MFPDTSNYTTNAQVTAGVKSLPTVKKNDPVGAGHARDIAATLRELERIARGLLHGLTVDSEALGLFFEAHGAKIQK